MSIIRIPRGENKSIDRLGFFFFPTLTYLKNYIIETYIINFSKYIGMQHATLNLRKQTDYIFFILTVVEKFLEKKKRVPAQLSRAINISSRNRNEVDFVLIM